MVLPDIFDFADYGHFLSEWKKVRGLSHRQVAAMTGQRDEGVLSNLIEKRRPFTRELQAAFAPIIPLSRDGARFLRALVDHHEASASVSRSEEALASAEARLASKPSQKLRNHVRIATATLEMAQDDRRRAEGEIKTLKLLHQALPQRGAALQLASNLLASTIEELSRCQGFSQDPGWIRQRLLSGHDETDIQGALQAVRRAGVALPGVDCSASVSEQPFVTENQVAAANVQPYYLAVYAELGRALAELFEREAAWRRARLGGVTLALPETAVPAVGELIDRFREDVVALETQIEGPKTDVFQVVVACFPLTGRGGPAPGDL